MAYEAYCMKELGFTTRQLHAGYNPAAHYRSKAVPVYQTAVFELGDYDRCLRLFEYAEEGHSYVRFSNPTNEVLEKRITSLEGGTAAVAMASGMAAISNTILNLCEPGDEIIAVSTLYGGSTTLISSLLPRYGIRGRIVRDENDMESYREITDPQEVYDTVKEAYEEQFSLTWLDYAQANDGQGLFISKAASDEYGILTISDLQANADKLRFASQGEFDEREDGLPGLEKIYGPFEFKSSKIYDNGLKYSIVENDEADVAPAYTTEGRLAEKDKFVLLEDDKQAWPPYNLAPVVRDDVLEGNPDIAEILGKVNAALDTETITALNAQVDVDKEEVEDVAADFYAGLSE